MLLFKIKCVIIFANSIPADMIANVVRLIVYIRHQTSYTHFCRLLLTLKANYQLQELAKLEGYRTWIHAISDFTIKSFNSWEVFSLSSFLIFF